MTLELVKSYVSANDWQDYIRKVWPKERKFYLDAIGEGDYGELSLIKGRHYVTLPYAARDDEAAKRFKEIFTSDIDAMKSKIQSRTWRKELRSKPARTMRKVCYPISSFGGILVGSVSAAPPSGNPLDGVKAGLGAFLGLVLFTELPLLSKRSTREQWIKALERAKNNITVEYVQDSFESRL